MTYQFKYMDIPEQKRSGGGGFFKGFKLLLELAVTVVALATLYNYNVGKSNEAMKAAHIPAAAIIHNQASLPHAIYQQTGIAPNQEALTNAQKMAEQFMATGDMTDFEKHANSGEIALEY